MAGSITLCLCLYFYLEQLTFIEVALEPKGLFAETPGDSVTKPVVNRSN